MRWEDSRKNKSCEPFRLPVTFALPGKRQPGRFVKAVIAALWRWTYRGAFRAFYNLPPTCCRS
jgi:hypothetical protein